MGSGGGAKSKSRTSPRWEQRKMDEKTEQHKRRFKPFKRADVKSSRS